MLIRLPHWGLALLAATSLWPISTGRAQDTDTPAAKPPAADSKPDYEERSIQRRSREPRPHKIHDADPWKKHPPVWSIPDVTKDHHPYASPSSPAPGGGHYPGGPSGRFGQPYYYTATSPDTSGTGAGGAGYGAAGYGATGYGPAAYGAGMPMGGVGPGYGMVGQYPTAGGYPTMGGGLAAGSGYAGAGFGMGYEDGFGAGFDGGFGPAPAPAIMGPGMNAGMGGPSYGYGAGPGYGAAPAYGPGVGGYGSAGMGPPGAMYASLPGQLPGNPYYYHFGPGFYRNQEAGHYRFPYYTYRAPWYFPGHTSYNRDTNIPW